MSTLTNSIIDNLHKRASSAGPIEPEVYYYYTEWFGRNAATLTKTEVRQCESALRNLRNRTNMKVKPSTNDDQVTTSPQIHLMELEQQIDLHMNSINALECDRRNTLMSMLASSIPLDKRRLTYENWRSANLWDICMMQHVCMASNVGPMGGPMGCTHDCPFIRVYVRLANIEDALCLKREVD